MTPPTPRWLARHIAAAHDTTPERETFVPPRLSDTALAEAYRAVLLADLADTGSEVYRALAALGFGAGGDAAFPAGVSLYGYGHSYVAGAGASDAAHRFLDRLGVLLAAGPVDNRGVGGLSMIQTMHNIAVGAYGGWWTPGTRGLVVLDAVLNDVLHTSAATQAQDAVGFANALRTALRILRSGAVLDPWHSSVTAFGSITQFADSGVIPGGNARVAEAGAELVINNYEPTEITILGLGFALIGPRDPIAVSVDGTPVGSMTVSDRAAPSLTINGGKGAADYAYQLDSWHITGLPAGAKNVVLTPAAERFYFCGYATPSATPPSVIVVQDAPLLNYAETPWSKPQGDALLATRNATVAAICGEPEFADAAALKVADASAGYDPATMLAADDWHRNDAGYEALAQALKAVAVGFPSRTGLV